MQLYIFHPMKEMDIDIATNQGIFSRVTVFKDSLLQWLFSFLLLKKMN